MKVELITIKKGKETYNEAQKTSAIEYGTHKHDRNRTSQGEPGMQFFFTSLGTRKITLVIKSKNIHK